MLWEEPHWGRASHQGWGLALGAEPHSTGGASFQGRSLMPGDARGPSGGCRAECMELGDNEDRHAQLGQRLPDPALAGLPEPRNPLKGSGNEADARGCSRGSEAMPQIPAAAEILPPYGVRALLIRTPLRWEDEVSR